MVCFLLYYFELSFTTIPLNTHLEMYHVWSVSFYLYLWLLWTGFSFLSHTSIVQLATGSTLNEYPLKTLPDITEVVFCFDVVALYVLIRLQFVLDNLQLLPPLKVDYFYALILTDHTVFYRRTKVSFLPVSVREAPQVPGSVAIQSPLCLQLLMKPTLCSATLLLFSGGFLHSICVGS